MNVKKPGPLHASFLFSGVILLLVFPTVSTRLQVFAFLACFRPSASHFHVPDFPFFSFHSIGNWTLSLFLYFFFGRLSLLP